MFKAASKGGRLMPSQNFPLQSLASRSFFLLRRPSVVNGRLSILPQNN